MTVTIQEYIDSKKWEYKVIDSDHGKEINIRNCPFCHDDKFHFYVNSISGQFLCHQGDCGESGSLYTLKKYLGDVAPVYSFSDVIPQEAKEVIDTSHEMEMIDKAHANLLKNKKALRYLAKRKFSLEAIKYFRLGYAIEDGVEWIWYPYIYKEQLKNIKKRSIPPHEKAFKRMFGGESSLFNEEVLDEKFDEIILSEGESDAIALWSQGIRNVVGVTVGAGGIKSSWIDCLDKFARIYFVYDSDIAGVSGAQRFANRLGLERCFNVSLPHSCKDVNEYFIGGHTVEEFLELKNQAIKFDVESVKSLGLLLQESMWKFYDQVEDEGLEWPWPSVTKLIGKMAPGDLFTLAAKPGVGKTTFALNLLHHFSTHDIPSLLFELEMRPERLLPRLVSLHKRTPNANTYEVLSSVYTELRDTPLYFAYKYEKLNWDIVSDTIRMCVRRYGLRFVVFDNLHFLVRGTDITREISTVTRDFKLLAEELAIAILLIARPRKIGADKIMDSVDLKDSADIEGDSDAVVILHRKKRKEVEGSLTEENGIFLPECLVRVDKMRWASGGDTYLRFIDAEARVEENI